MFQSDPKPLSVAQQAQYADDGFLVLPKVLHVDACAALMRHAKALAERLRPLAPQVVFESSDAERSLHAAFLASARGVQCFFEPSGDRVVNKIGHALHALDPVFAPFSAHRLWYTWAIQLGVRAAKACQSMLIFKQPGAGSAVQCHQDATYLHTEPTNGLGLWFALEDATSANGCLWALRGGHRQGLKRRFVQQADGLGVTRTLDSAPFTGAWIPLEVAAGSVVLLHGLCPHRSDANPGPLSRLAYTLHLIDAHSRYSADNWLKEPL